MDSLWKKTQLPEFKSLRQDTKTKVLIIGGGLTGLLCAWMLEKEGIDYILVEENRICSGTTGCTTAKISCQHGLIYQKLIKQFGMEQAALYYRANARALETYQHMAEGLDCDFEEKDSYLYARHSDRKLQDELAALCRLGVDARWEKHIQLPFPVAGAVCLPGQAQFHPLKFAAGISKDLRIYEHTPVLSYENGRYITEHAVIKPEKTIVATHFPMWNKHGMFPLKLYQDRSYVLGLVNAQSLDGMYRDADAKGLSFRMAGNVLLLGGGAHRTGKNGGGVAELIRAAQEYFPGAAARYQWAAQDCMSLDGMPYIGRYSPNTPDLYVATGYNKWGMTSAMVAAQLLTQLVQGRSDPCEKLFSPSRSMLHPQLAVNGAEAILHLLKPTVPRCPHMGCALTWNSQEHSWDCPCHGSRFAADGTRLDNPATADMKKNDR